jgi:hypothetical protein
MLIFYYNLYFYHNLAGGQLGAFNSVSLDSFSISHFLTGFFGLLISPARGFIFYTPLFIFGFISLGFIKKMQKKEVAERVIFNLNLANFFGCLLLNSFWVTWWAGWGWGDRMLTDAACSAII